MGPLGRLPSRERKKIFYRTTNLRAQRMDWVSGTPTSTWANVEGKKESELSEEWGGKQRMGPLGRLPSRERKKIFSRTNNLQVQRMGWGAGTSTGRRVNVEGRRVAQSSEEWGRISGWGRSDGHAIPIKHGNIGKSPSIYNSNSEEHNIIRK